MNTPTAPELEDFWGYCRTLTPKQMYDVVLKEENADREHYALIARMTLYYAEQELLR